ncbi:MULTISPECIES: HAD family hydrolase [unclassified Paenibacillus]|uniref:HAD family hydrolase n=1 Tax=unclassified Paenibacillus TaxID=185978 RepID=UPI001050501B|nr:MULTISPECIES: HAD family hydrolase [unclassified Paenibacillus]NIK69154.1 putative hydrolase of the HAD superfamily [Paenibacillus sp. BK720]TCM92889.1 putative hydrolase of the HAD superfamily [Paenibacillus sp. BK033]
MGQQISVEKKGVFFDVDDTLYDHLSPFRQAVIAVVGDREGFPYEEAYHRMRYHSDMLSLEMGGAGAMESGSSTELMRRRRFELALAEFGIALSEEQASAMQAAYIGCQFNIAMFEGARELIEQLVKAGYVVGLLTNGAENHQLKKIRAMELDHLIPPERQFVSGKIGWDKPDIRVFQHVNEATGTRPEKSVYIGDSWRNDVIGALEAGWSVIWFNHRGASPESGEHTPNHTAASYEELARLLL